MILVSVMLIAAPGIGFFVSESATLPLITAALDFAVSEKSNKKKIEINRTVLIRMSIQVILDKSIP
jgi:hypothetical protein